MIPMQEIDKLIMVSEHLFDTSDSVKITNKKQDKQNFFVKVPEEYWSLLDPNDGLDWHFDFFYCQDAVCPHTDFVGNNPRGVIIPLDWSEKDQPKVLFYNEYNNEKTIYDWEHDCGEFDRSENYEIGKPIFFDTKQLHHSGEVNEWKLAIVGQGKND